MQRDPRKHLGGMWEATAGWAALQGEDPMTCALRELSEETGIKADKLTEVGRVLHHLHKSIYVDYLCETDADKTRVIVEQFMGRGVNMPISDLRNYTEALKEVDNKKRVYHTRNGHGAYAIMTVAEADELDRIRAARALAADLRRAEERANREGWIDADDFDRKMGIID